MGDAARWENRGWNRGFVGRAFASKEEETTKRMAGTYVIAIWDFEAGTEQELSFPAVRILLLHSVVSLLLTSFSVSKGRSAKDPGG